MTYIPTFVSLRTFQLFILASIIIVTKSIDITNSGCECELNWQYKSQIFVQGECANPDNDIRGPWCIINSEKPCTGLCFKEPYGKIDGKLYDHCPIRNTNNNNKQDVIRNEVLVETEIMPGELLGLWKGDWVDEDLDENGSFDSPSNYADMDICATEGSPRLKITDDVSGTEIHIVKKVTCTGEHVGFFFSELLGQTQCHKFYLDVNHQPEPKLFITSHYDSRPYDCGPLMDDNVGDNEDSTRRVARLIPVEGQAKDPAMLLCQPRFPPNELVGRWQGTTKTQSSNVVDGSGDDNVETTICPISVFINTNNNNEKFRLGLTISSTGECNNSGNGMNNQEDVLKQERTDTIFDAHIDQCERDGSNIISKGTLLAYTDDEREICYRFIRSTDGSLLMAYQVTKHPERNYHACPDEIKVSKDIAEIKLNLNGAGISSFDWLCQNSTGGLSLVPRSSTKPFMEGQRQYTENSNVVFGVLLGGLVSSALVTAVIFFASVKRRSTPSEVVVTPHTVSEARNTEVTDDQGGRTAMQII